MLNPDRNILRPVPMPAYDAVALGDVLTVVRRSKLLIAVAVVVGMIGAFGLSRLYPDRYTAEAVLIASPAMSRTPDLRNENVALQVDPMAIRTIVETIGSTPIVAKAIQSLPPHSRDLLAEAVPAKKSGAIPFCPDALCGAFAGKESADAPDRPAADPRAVINYVSRALSIENGGRSYIVQVRYVASDPDLSAAVANAVVDEYMSFRTRQRQSFLGETSANLKGKLASLKMELQQAERAAQGRREQVRIQEAQSASLTGSQQEKVISEKADAYAMLREAEREAQAIASVYEHFLLRQRELEGRYDFPDGDVQLLSNAQVPLEKDGIGLKLFVALGAMAGLLAGISIAILRSRRKESLDND